MNIYLLTQRDENGMDTFDSCVVVAKTTKKAKEIHPRGELYSSTMPSILNSWNYSTWTNTPDKVKAYLIGKAAKDQKENTVICSSFNAG